MRGNRPKRFALLRHTVGADFQRTLSDDSHQGDHFDWLFETGPDLTTFASKIVNQWQSRWTTHCVKLPNHRAVYLNFEGPLPSRDEKLDRGRVDRVLHGKILTTSVPDATKTPMASTSPPDQYRFLLSIDRSQMEPNTIVPAKLRLHFSAVQRDRWSLTCTPLAF